MPLSERGKEIANAFHKYTKTGNKSFIKAFSRDEIIATMAEYSLDRNMGWYKIMEDRIAEIDAKAQSQRERKDKLKDKVVTFIPGLILMWIGSKYFARNTP